MKTQDIQDNAQDIQVRYKKLAEDLEYQFGLHNLGRIAERSVPAAHQYLNILTNKINESKLLENEEGYGLVKSLLEREYSQDKFLRVEVKIEIKGTTCIFHTKSQIIFDHAYPDQITMYYGTEDHELIEKLALLEKSNKKTTLGIKIELPCSTLTISTKFPASQKEYGYENDNNFYSIVDDKLVLQSASVEVREVFDKFFNSNKINEILRTATPYSYDYMQLKTANYVSFLNNQITELEGSIDFGDLIKQEQAKIYQNYKYNFKCDYKIVNNKIVVTAKPQVVLDQSDTGLIFSFGYCEEGRLKVQEIKKSLFPEGNKDSFILFTHHRIMINQSQGPGTCGYYKTKQGGVGVVFNSWDDAIAFKAKLKLHDSQVRIIGKTLYFEDAKEKATMRYDDTEPLELQGHEAVDLSSHMKLLPVVQAVLDGPAQFVVEEVDVLQICSQKLVSLLNNGGAGLEEAAAAIELIKNEQAKVAQNGPKFKCDYKIVNDQVVLTAKPQVVNNIQEAKLTFSFGCCEAGRAKVEEIKYGLSGMGYNKDMISFGHHTITVNPSKGYGTCGYYKTKQQGVGISFNNFYYAKDFQQQLKLHDSQVKVIGNVLYFEGVNENVIIKYDDTEPLELLGGTGVYDEVDLLS